jgi:hypothetical protein
MTIIPSVWYSKYFESRIHTNTYFHRDYYFVGLIVYHDLDGNFVNGWKYEQGRITGRLEAATAKGENTIAFTTPEATYKVREGLKSIFGPEDQSGNLSGGTLGEAVVTGNYSGGDNGTIPPDFWDNLPESLPHNPGVPNGGGGNSSGGYYGGDGNSYGSGSNTYAVTISLDIPSTMTLGTGYTITTVINPPKTLSYISYQIKNIATDQDYTIQSTPELICSTRAYRPGNYSLKAVVLFADGSNRSSNTININIQFPYYTEIIANATVLSQMNSAWAETKISNGSGLYAERGFAIYLNTGLNTYQFGSVGNLDRKNPCTSALVKANISISWFDPKDPRQGAQYPVATFHTHPPYLCGSSRRPVGPSGLDISYLATDYVNFVYDYTGTNGYLYFNHGIDDPAKIYHFGLERGKYKD